MDFRNSLAFFSHYAKNGNLVLINMLANYNSK